MSQKSRFERAIEFIDQQGILLVFPVKNQKDADSLWARFHPRTPLRWEWTDDGDDKVFQMWHLMKELSDCEQVVYSKWYQGRATYFSRELFQALYFLTMQNSELFESPPDAYEDLMEVLTESSPLSTKELKKHTDLRGKDCAAIYNRGMKWAFTRFLIVGYGEEEDGSFPSLKVAKTDLIYEDLVSSSEKLNPQKALEIVNKYMPQGSAFRKFLFRNLKI